MSMTYVAYLILWFFGFLFLFRIPNCQKGKVKKGDRPRVSVIIPARNEETTLPNLLASLRGQIKANDEVIVVDDHSEDKTRAVAEQESAMVIKSKPLPPGWIGKTWACYQGAKEATGEILVFLDADTVIEDNGLSKIIDTYINNDGVLSIQPFHKMVKPYEQLSVFFNLVMMAAMGSFTILGNLIKPIGLFGPVVVLTRQRYIESGGYEKVKGEILEDLAYGSEFKKQSIRIYCYGGRHTVSFRMYSGGIRELLTGWSKGFATGAAKTSIPMLIMIIAWITGAIGTARHLVQAAAITDSQQITLWGILYVLYVSQIYWMLFRIGNFKLYTALLYPIPLLFFVIVFVYSFTIIFLRRRVKWKGRKIDVKHRGHNVIPSANNNNRND